MCGSKATNEQTLSERFLKLGEIQKMLNVSRSTVWRWHSERGLKVVRVGDVVRVRESDLEAFVNQHLKGEPLAASGTAPIHSETNS